MDGKSGRTVKSIYYDENGVAMGCNDDDFTNPKKGMVNLIDNGQYEPWYAAGHEPLKSSVAIAITVVVAIIFIFVAIWGAFTIGG